MPNDIIPAAGDPIPPAPQPNDHDHKRSIVCEVCGSKLDRRGGVLRRGDLAKEMIQAEDTITELRKQLKTAQDTIAERDTTISELRTQAPPKPRSRFSPRADA